MSDDHRQKLLESKLTRKKGMTSENREAIAQFNATTSDWYGTCRVCHERLTGTLKQIREHKHGE